MSHELVESFHYAGTDPGHHLPVPETRSLHLEAGSYLIAGLSGTVTLTHTGNLVAVEDLDPIVDHSGPSVLMRSKGKFTVPVTGDYQVTLHEGKGEVQVWREVA